MEPTTFYGIRRDQDYKVERKDLPSRSAAELASAVGWTVYRRFNFRDVTPSWYPQVRSGSTTPSE